MDFHRVFRLIFAFGVGIALALYVYQRVTDPQPAEQRAREEAVVHAARDFLRAAIPTDGDLEIVDPLAKNREAGKVYIFPADGGWQVSGHYRRGPADRWHPFLMTLDADARLLSLSVRDADSGLRRAAEADPQLTIVE